MPEYSAKKTLSATRKVTNLSESPRRTQAERKEIAERKIAEAALKIIAEKGLGGLTLAEAGERAGYSRGIASHHFGKKNDLLIAVVNGITFRFNHYLQEKPNLNSGLDMIHAVINLYFVGAIENSDTARTFHLVLAESITNIAIQDAISQLNQRAIKNLAYHIEQAIIRKEVRHDMDPRTQATMLIAGLRGIIAQWLIDDERVNLVTIKKEFLANLNIAWRNKKAGQRTRSSFNLPSLI